MKVVDMHNAQLIKENRRLLKALREREMLLLEVLDLLKGGRVIAGTKDYIAAKIRVRLKQWGLIGE